MDLAHYGTFRYGMYYFAESRLHPNSIQCYIIEPSHTTETQGILFGTIHMRHFYRVQQDALSIDMLTAIIKAREYFDSRALAYREWR